MLISRRDLWIALTCVAIFLSAGVKVRSAHAQDQQAGIEPAPPWELTRTEPGEPYWAPLLRLREAEPQYRDTRWWGAYAQMRAFVEAGVGNHAAALQAWDWAYPPRDSIGTLPSSLTARKAIEFLDTVADTARVIMINERHHASSDRLLTLALLPLLREKGYRYFAAETFDPSNAELNSRTYPTKDTGVYASDPVFAAIVREAVRLGYTLVSYESTGELEEGDENLTKQQQRDIAQARNLARATVARYPDAKVLVHAGYSHVLETASERFYPMALYFRELTGIDPVTVDQTRLCERSQPAYEHPAYRAAVAAGMLQDAPVVLVGENGRPYLPADFDVDLQVLTPRTRYVHGRPTWMTMGDLRCAVEVNITKGGEKWCLVEARVDGEPSDAIPLDRCEVRESTKAWVFIPAGVDVVINVLGADGTVLQTTRHH